MKRKIVVHFGAGALGRGLVIPMFYYSHCQVVVADTDKRLISYLKNQRSYKLQISDDEKRPVEIIPIEDVISPLEDEEKLIKYLKECSIVSTSVRKENLIHVAKVLAKAWNDVDVSEKMVVCCENVEGIGSYFKSLLLENVDEDKKAHFSPLLIPDTIVDRICAVKENIEEIVSEKFHECSVDGEMVLNTNLEMIPAVQHIKAHFYRKRYLLNTYADAIAFIGKNKGHTYLYECAKDKELQLQIQPYIKLLMDVLYYQFDVSYQESQEWFDVYRNRLCNSKIPRNLDTVARNLWEKLNIGERFVCPLLELMKYDVDIQGGIPILYELIFSQSVKEGLSKEETMSRLKDIWCVNTEGEALFKTCKDNWL
ncbi:mannitol dehydrogenase family protein [Amedibacillus sp. YH-ame6]